MTTPLDVAADVALRLAGAGDEELDAVVTDTLALLAHEAKADRTYITLYDVDGTFENSHEWTPEGVVPQRPVIQRLRSEDFAYSYHLALRNEVLAAPDLMALPAEADAEKRSFASFGVKAVLQVPIVVNGEGVGLVGFNNFHTDVEWPDDLIDFIRRVGQAIGVALMRERAARTIRRAYEEAERANRAKDELLAQVSHELRTPLHAMLGYAELLELDVRSDHDRDALLQIQFNGRRLLTMVEDLIAIADEGVERSTSDVELRPVVDSAIDALDPVARQRNIDVEVGESLAGVTLRAELGRIRQVLYCAMSGAVQSIHGGGAITVDVVEPAGANQCTLQLRLSSTRPLQGAGMVMPLAKALLDGHGTIELEARSDTEADVVIFFDEPLAA